MTDDSNQSAATSTGDEPTVGRQLRSAREAAHLELSKVAEDLKLTESVVRALEEDRFADVGASVFVKGHLRQYADLLNLDADTLLSSYQAGVDPDDERVVVNKPIKLQEDHQVAVGIGAVGFLAAIGVAAYLWWGDEPGAPTLDTEPMMSEELLSEPEFQVPEPSGEVTPSSAQPEPDPPAEQPAPSASPGSIQLELRFDQDSWVEITDGSDRRVFYGLGQAGARSTVEAALPVQFLLGNADGVEVVINGTPFGIPAGSREGNLARFVLTEDDF